MSLTRLCIGAVGFLVAICN